jgi:GAF domain-containing protein
MAELDDPVRLSRFQGLVASSKRDDVLEACAQEAATAAEAPIALVSFVMGHVQYFRAGVGLPPELDLSRATSRCHSYCQYVVLSEKPLVIHDIVAAPDMPQALAQTYGIRSYLGLPVKCGGQTLGTLCVVDVKTRDWGPALVTRLLPIAKRVSERLDALFAIGQPSVDAIASMAEARLLAESVATGARVIERALAEVGPLVRLAGGLGKGSLPVDAFVRGATALREAVDLYFDLVTAAREVGNSGQQLKVSLDKQAGPRAVS